MYHRTNYDTGFILERCDRNFNPRTDATKKVYSYKIRYRERVVWKDKKIMPICSDGGPELLRNALDGNKLWVCPWALDNSKIEQYCEALRGTHDYSLFVHKKSVKKRDNRMTVSRFSVEKKQVAKEEDAPMWAARFIIEAKGFGRSQVRNMVGFVVDCARGKFDDDHLAANDDWVWQLQRYQISSAPAMGLCLEKVIY